MKPKTFLVIVGLLSVAPLCLGQSVPFRNLPSAAQKSVLQLAKGDPVKSVTSRIEQGRTFYDVEVERKNAPNRRVTVTEDGLILTTPAQTASSVNSIGGEPALPIDAVDGSASSDSAAIATNLPSAVKDTIKRVAGDRSIANVARKSWHGRNTFLVDFNSPGVNPRITILEDGTLLASEEARGGIVGQAAQTLVHGTKLQETPRAVQETINRESRGRTLDDIEVRERNGTRVYKVEFRDGVRTEEIHIAEDGHILDSNR